MGGIARAHGIFFPFSFLSSIYHTSYSKDLRYLFLLEFVVQRNSKARTQEVSYLCQSTICLGVPQGLRFWPVPKPLHDGGF